MNHKPFIVLVVALGVMTMFDNAIAAGSKFKCWTNKEGVRECGNVVPPEYSQKGHEVIDERGVTVERVERALTKEEAAARQREEDARAAQARLAEEREQHDRILLKTYSNTDELKMARDGRLAALDTEITITEQNLEKTRAQLQELNASADKHRKGGKPLPEDLAGDLERVQAQFSQYETFLARKQQERAQIDKQFAEDIARFKAMKGLR